MVVTQGLFNLRAIEPRTEPLRSISNGEYHCGRFRHMLLELRQVYFVEVVGTCMIIDQVIRSFLVGYQRGHAFQHEIEIIRAPFRVRGQRGRVKLFQRPYNWFAALTTSLRPPSENPVT